MSTTTPPPDPLDDANVIRDVADYCRDCAACCDGMRMPVRAQAFRALASSLATPPPALEGVEVELRKLLDAASFPRSQPVKLFADRDNQEAGRLAVAAVNHLPALLSALAGMPRWQRTPAEKPGEFPFTGERLIIAWDDIPSLPAHIELGRWRSGTGKGSGWCNTYGHSFSGSPTHFMNLPALQTQERTNG